MKEGWEIKQIGDVCQVIAGQSPEGKYYNNNGNGMPFYQGKKDFTEKFLGEPTTWTTDITKEAKPGDILMSVRAPVGPVNFSTGIVCIGRGLAAIRAGKLVDKEFLFYFFLNYESKIVGNAGAVFSSINKAQIESIEFPIPPLPEQQRIVSVLEEAFASIAQVKANAERNLVNARELFESVLESFFEDPQHTPNGKELESLCKLIVDCEHKTAPIQDEGYPSIRTPNIGRGYLILEGVNRVSEETYTRWTRRAIPQGGDLILAREAPAGNVVVIPDGLEVCLGQRTVLIRPDNKIFISQYLMWLLLSGNVQKFFLQNSKGSTVVHVNMKDIRGLKINNILPLREQRAIVERLEALSAETGRLEENYRSKLDALEELKKSVLQKAFEGGL